MPPVQVIFCSACLQYCLQASGFLSEKRSWWLAVDGFLFLSLYLSEYKMKYAVFFNNSACL